MVLILTGLLAFCASFAYAFNAHALNSRREHTDGLLASVYDTLELDQVQSDISARTSQAVRIFAVNGELMKYEDRDDRILLRVRLGGHPASSAFVAWLKARLRQTRKCHVILVFVREGGKVNATIVQSVSGVTIEPSTKMKHADVRMRSVKPNQATEEPRELPLVVTEIAPSDLEQTDGPSKTVFSVGTYTVIFRE